MASETSFPGTQVPPRPGQQVQVSGRDEVFVILRIDKSRHLADLLREGLVRKVEAGVPLALLRVVGEPAPECRIPPDAS